MQRLSILKNLILMARADGRIDDAEQRLLDAHCRKWGISVADFNKVLAESERDDATIYIPESPTLRHDLLAEMALLMAADGRIDELELQLLSGAAERMGVRGEALEEIIEEFTDRDDDLLLGED